MSASLGASSRTGRKQQRNLKKWTESHLDAGDARPAIVAEIESHGWLFGADATKYVDGVAKRLAEMEELRPTYHALYKTWFMDRLVISLIYIAAGTAAIVLVANVLFESAPWLQIISALALCGTVFFGVKVLFRALFCGLIALSLSGRGPWHVRARRILGWLANRGDLERLRLEAPRYYS